MDNSRGGFGEVDRAKYWFAKRNFEKYQTVRLGGGGVRCVQLPVNSQVFCTNFAYFQLFRLENLAPEGSIRWKHLRRHFEVQVKVFRQIIACAGHLGHSKIHWFLLNVTFLELLVTERIETAESSVLRQALFVQRTINFVSERARGLESTHTIYLFDSKTVPVTAWYFRRPKTSARNPRWVRYSIPRGSPTWVSPILFFKIVFSTIETWQLSAMSLFRHKSRCHRSCSRCPWCYSSRSRFAAFQIAILIKTLVYTVCCCFSSCLRSLNFYSQTPMRQVPVHDIYERQFERAYASSHGQTNIEMHEMRLCCQRFQQFENSFTPTTLRRWTVQMLTLS